MNKVRIPANYFAAGSTLAAYNGAVGDVAIAKDSNMPILGKSGKTTLVNIGNGGGVFVDTDKLLAA
jgi:hypothetical protein